MPEGKGFPAGVPAWVDSSQPDAEAGIEFYGELFGWQFDERGAGDPDDRYAVATLDGKTVAAIASPSTDGASKPDWMTYVTVDDGDATAARVVEAGGTVVTEPRDRFGLARTAICADPAGATFGLWQPGSVKGAESVNAPGTWNFSELNTDDAGAAKSFYGSVFGWEADEVEMGPMSGLMVRVPGYADFLELYNPGVKQRHIDFGA